MHDNTGRGQDSYSEKRVGDSRVFFGHRRNRLLWDIKHVTDSKGGIK